jgi:hypothetical protein
MRKNTIKILPLLFLIFIMLASSCGIFRKNPYKRRKPNKKPCDCPQFDNPRYGWQNNKNSKDFYTFDADSLLLSSK